MEKVKLEVEVPKESHELAKCLCELGAMIIDKKKDGLQLHEIIEIVTSQMGQFIKAVEGIELLGVEAKEDGLGIAAAFVIEAQKIQAALKV